MGENWKPPKSSHLFHRGFPFFYSPSMFGVLETSISWTFHEGAYRQSRVCWHSSHTVSLQLLQTPLQLLLEKWKRSTHGVEMVDDFWMWWVDSVWSFPYWMVETMTQEMWSAFLRIFNITHLIFANMLHEHNSGALETSFREGQSLCQLVCSSPPRVTYMLSWWGIWGLERTLHLWPIFVKLNVLSNQPPSVSVSIWVFPKIGVLPNHPF